MDREAIEDLHKRNRYLEDRVAVIERKLLDQEVLENEMQNAILQLNVTTSKFVKSLEALSNEFLAYMGVDPEGNDNGQSSDGTPSPNVN